MTDPIADLRTTAAALIRANVVHIKALDSAAEPTEEWANIVALGEALDRTPGVEPGLPVLAVAQVAAAVIRRLAEHAGLDPVEVMQHYVIGSELYEE